MEAVNGQQVGAKQNEGGEQQRRVAGQLAAAAVGVAAQSL